MEDYQAYARYLKHELREERKRSDGRQAEIIVLYVTIFALLILLALSVIA